MPSLSAPSLASLVQTHGVHESADFIADDKTRINILSLAEVGAQSGLLEHLRGKSVLLALPRQLATIAALLQLDGVARRLILCPQEAFRGQIGTIMELAGVDVAITAWPLPVPGDDGPLCLCDMSDLRADPAPASATPWATEWVLFTSGTTGQPKMVVHTLQSLSGHLAAGAAPGSGKPVWCTFYDIRRYGGLQIMLRALVGGGSLVLSSTEESPAAFLARAATAHATHFLGTPSHWRRALMTDAQTLISPSYVRLSGEVADQVILDRLRSTYPRAAVVHAFASTECGLALEVSDGQAGFPADLIGQAGGAADLRVCDGTLQVRSARTAAGTLKGRMNLIADPNGFVDTGDMVELRDGRYYFVGRRDGIVNVGGQKVHPEEVEAVINQHPEVQMSLVSARSNPITGAIVVADIVSKPGHSRARPSLTGTPATFEDEIRAFCRSRLAPHMVPASIRLVASLDIAPTGKMVRLRA